MEVTTNISMESDPAGRKSYEPPRLVRYGAMRELTQGANHITTNITDILSIQASDRELKRDIVEITRPLERLRAL